RVVFIRVPCPAARITTAAGFWLTTPTLAKRSMVSVGNDEKCAPPPGFEPRLHSSKGCRAAITLGRNTHLFGCDHRSVFAPTWRNLHLFSARHPPGGTRELPPLLANSH